MKKSILLFFILALILPNSLFAQSTPIDSLAQEALSLSVIDRIGYQHRIIQFLDDIKDPSEKLTYAQQIQRIAKSRQDSFFLGFSHFQLAHYYKLLRDTINQRINADKHQLIQSNYGYHVDESPNEYQRLFHSLRIFQDKKGNTPFEVVRAHDSLFTTNNTVENHESETVYWAKVILHGSVEKNKHFIFNLSVDDFNQSWENIDIWFVPAKGKVIRQKTGSSLSKEEKAIPTWLNLARFEIKQQEKVTLYFRFQGVSEKKENRPNQISLNFLDEAIFPGIVEGYPFKGYFSPDSDKYFPFKANDILYHEFYEDPSKEATIAEISKNWNQLDRTNFLDTKQETDKVYWLKARFYGSPYFNGEQIFQIGPSSGKDIFSFDYMDAYTSDGQGGYTHQRTGDQVPLKERPYHFWANFIKLTINPTDTIDLFIRMEGADRRYLMNNILLFHVDKSSVFPRQVNEAIKNGLFYGILGIQCLYFLLLFFIEKDKIHLYFSFFSIGLLLGNGFVWDNFDSFVLFSFWRNYHLPLFYFGLFLTQFGFLKFTEVYFKYPKASIFSKWVLPIFFVISSLVSLSAVMLVEITPIYKLSSNVAHLLAVGFPMLSIIISLLMVFYAKKHKSVSKKFFLIAFLPLLLIICFKLLQVMGGFMPDIFFITNLFLSNLLYDFLKIGIIAMLILFALSTGYRTNRLKADKAEALQKNFEDQTRINKAISRFVPNEFMAALGKTDITQINLGDNIAKEVTVFFSDIRAYTALSEKMSPEETFQFVNAYNARMGPIIQKNNGFVNQYLGDGIMAIFNNSPTDALKAAIGMQKAIQNFNLERTQTGKRGINVGMGMHTGSLIMGITGDANRLDATTISDSVNSAARIENLCKHYGTSILLSEDALENLDKPKAFNFRYLGQVQVKGKQKVLKIYECFDGDLPQMIAAKKTTLIDFNTGIHHYFNQDFTKALSFFENVLQQNPNDKTAQLFLMKSKQLIQMGTEEQWTGVETMYTK